MVRITAPQPEELPGNGWIYKDFTRDVKLKRHFSWQNAYKLCKHTVMAIDPTLDPDMHLSGNGPKTLNSVITTYARLIYAPPTDQGMGHDICPKSEALRAAVAQFRKAAQQSMQFDMDTLAGQRNPQMRYTPLK